MLNTIKKEMAVSFLRHYVKLFMLKNTVSGEEEAIAEITKKLPILAFSEDETEKIGASFISKNKWMLDVAILYPTNGTEINSFDSLFEIPAATVEGHAALETCTFFNVFHDGNKLSDLCRKEEAGLDDAVFSLFPKKISWSSVRDKKFSAEFLEENVEKMNWSTICSTQELTEEFMRKYADKLKWDDVSRHQKLSEEFMDYFMDKLVWYNLCEYQTMSEEFMSEHTEKMDWNTASRHQEMSIEFIETFKEKLNWNHLCRHKDLPSSFIETHWDRIDVSTVLQCANLDESLLEKKYGDFYDRQKNNLFSYQGVSKAFCDRHKNDIRSRSSGATWQNLFDNKKLLHFDFKGTIIHKDVEIDDVESLIDCHKGPIMVKPQRCAMYFRTVFVRSKNRYRVTTTPNGYKNWKKRFSPLESDLFTIDETMALISSKVRPPVEEEKETK